jgi:hypothetical protein
VSEAATNSGGGSTGWIIGGLGVLGALTGLGIAGGNDSQG